MWVVLLLLMVFDVLKYWLRLREMARLIVILTHIEVDEGRD